MELEELAFIFDATLYRALGSASMATQEQTRRDFAHLCCKAIGFSVVAFEKGEVSQT